jgi:hypothetical protein
MTVLADETGRPLTDTSANDYSSAAIHLTQRYSR